MVFNPSTYRVNQRDVVTAALWNNLITAISTHLNNLTGADLAAPLVLSKASQDLDGDGNYIYAFKRWLGHGGNVSIRDVGGFGATGDGSTDDSDAIIAAIEDLPKTGGVVLFPPGTYVVGKTIQMLGEGPQYSPLSTTTLMGFGRASSIKIGAGLTETFAIEVGDGAQNMSLVNLKIDGSVASNTDGGGIDASRSVRTSIMNCWIENAALGIDVGGVTNATISGCFFMGDATYNITSKATKGPGDGLLIDGCNFYNSIDNSIDLTPGPNHTVISNNQLYSSSASGMRIGSRNDISMTDVIINGNSIRDCTSHGIELRNISSDVRMSGIAASNNHILESGEHGIFVDQTGNSDIRGVTIHGNAIMNSDDAGIRINGAKLISVNDNVCLRNGQDSGSATRYGISLGGDEDNEAEFVTITGNTCAEDQSPETQQYGINLDANTKNCVVVANSISGNAVAGIRNLGTDNDIGHNAGQA